MIPELSGSVLILPLSPKLAVVVAVVVLAGAAVAATVVVEVVMVPSN